MYNAPSLLAQAECRIPGSPTTPLPLRRLRCCVDLHSSSTGEPLSTVTGVPSILKDEVLFLPADDANFHSLDGIGQHAATGGKPSASSNVSEVFVKGTQPMRVCILWPALQEPPAWLTEEYDLVKGAEVQVSDAQQVQLGLDLFYLQCWRCPASSCCGATLALWSWNRRNMI
jgi:hypothetical protein